MTNNFKTDTQIIQFSDNIKTILKGMMGLATPSISIKGKKKQVEALIKTLLQEKQFLEKYQKHGADHPKTKVHKSLLKQSIEEFEDLMGIDWPLRE